MNQRAYPFLVFCGVLAAQGCNGCSNPSLNNADSGSNARSSSGFAQPDAGQAGSSSTGSGTSAGTSEVATSAGGSSTSAPATSTLPDAGITDAGFDAGTTPDAGIGTCTATCGTWVYTTPLPTHRNRHTATLLANDKVLIAGGDDQMGPVKTCLLFDPAAQTWTLTGELNDARYGHTATLLQDGRVLVAGGWGMSGASFGALATAEVYSNGNWTRVGALSAPRSGHTATLATNGRVVVAGGMNQTEYPAAVDSYNPTSNTFVHAGDITTLRYVHAAAEQPNNGVMLIGGRHVSDTLKSVEVHTTVSVAAGVDLPFPVWGHAATTLLDDRVLVTGGTRAAATPLAEAYVWNGTNTTWSSPLPMVTARWGHDSVRLASGKVLLVGGTHGDSTLNACELYDPGANTFHDVAWMNVPRLSHSASLLADGRVLVVGGTWEFDGLVSAEIYTPAP